jgi:hypothetical protein
VRAAAVDAAIETVLAAVVDAGTGNAPSRRR